MDDKLINDRIAQISAEYPALNRVVKEALVIDQDGLMTSSNLSDCSKSEDFIPQIHKPSSLSPPLELKSRMSSDADYRHYLDLMIPSQLHGKKDLSDHLISGIMNDDPITVAKAVRDIIFAARQMPLDRGRGRERSRTRTVTKPIYQEVLTKLSVLKTKSNQPMLSERWIGQIYEHCDASTLERLLRMEKVGNLALALKGVPPHKFNEKILRHMDLVG
ncbi:MAG: hypothetical protein [Barnaclevirus sp.]